MRAAVCREYLLMCWNRETNATSSVSVGVTEAEARLALEHCLVGMMMQGCVTGRLRVPERECYVAFRPGVYFEFWLQDSERTWN